MIGADPGQLFRILADLTLRATLFLVLVSGAAPLLRRSSAGIRHSLWAMGIAAMLILPAARAISPRLPIAIPSMVGAALSSFSGVEQPTGVPAGDLPPAGSTLGPTVSARSPGVGAWLFWIWIAGTLFLLARLGLATLRLSRAARRSEPMDHGDWLVAVQATARELGIRRPITVLVREDNRGPVTWGAVYPIVLLPDSARSWATDRRRGVLLHELAHVARMDTTTQAWAQLACALYWFHPLVWFAALRMRIERERACDDVVLSRGTLPSAYAEDLLTIARSLSPNTMPALAAVSIDRRSRFEDRVEAILDPTAARTAPSAALRGAGGIGALALIAFLAAFESAGPAVPATASCRIRAVDTDVTLTNAKPGRVAIVGNRSGNETLVGIYDGSHCLAGVLHGSVVFNNNLDDIESISPKGWFSVTDLNHPDRPRYTVSESGGTLVRRYEIGGKERPWAEGRDWAAASIGWLLRDYGYDPAGRVNRLVTTGGVAAALADIRRSRTDTGKRVMLEALLDRGGLSPDELDRVRRIADSLGPEDRSRLQQRLGSQQ